jgi:hypothetical protein
MTQPSILTLSAEPLFTLTTKVSAPRRVAGLPLGDRIIIDVTGGEFQGPRPSGCVLPSGGDWVSLCAASRRLDVRLLPETNDGVTILPRYTGIASLKDQGQRADVAGFLDAPDGDYAWLNKVHALGFGRVDRDVATYDFFHLL